MNVPESTEAELFEAALEYPTLAGRTAYLDQACAGQPELRRRVEALLEGHDQAGQFMEAAVAERPTITLDLVPEETPGTMIGRYKVLQKIGEGGMGVVYMAEQTAPVVRKVALKIIKLGMDTKAVVARFEAERQALALMDHPHIAKVLDAGATDSGRPYFVMELVHGVPITEYCDKNKLSTQQRLELFIPVCQAIQHAHQKGIIHRDIKPSNVMVTLHDGVPVPKVIDFGVAKATSQRLTEKTLFTNYAQMIGTPAYMSPEQAEMSGLDIDTRSDIYSLGVLLYELLTGTTPFDAKELLSKGYAEMQRIIAEQEPVKPSTRMSTLTDEQRTVVTTHRNTDASALRKVLQGDLDWIVMKCLEKDRTRRYETSNGLAADLRRHLNNELITARPPTTCYLLKKLIKRNRTAFATAAVVVASLIIGMVATTWQAVRATRAERLASQRLQESERARLDAEALSSFLTGVLQSPDPEKRGRAVTVADTLDAAAKKVETDLTSLPARQALLRMTLAKTYFALGMSKEAILLGEQAYQFHLTNSGPNDLRTLDAMHSLAVFYSDIGRRQEALELNEQVLAGRRKALGAEHPETIKAMMNLAVGYINAGRREEALQLRGQVVVLSRKVNGPEHPDTVSAMNNLANSYASAGLLEEALKLRQEVLELSRKVNGPEHPRTLTAMMNLANSCRDLGRPKEGIALHEEVLKIRRRVLGAEHPETIRCMQNLGNVYLQAGLGDQAVKMHEEALALAENRFGREHPDTITAIHNLATDYAAVGRVQEALNLQEEDLLLSRKVNGPEHPDTLDAMVSLANCHAKAGRWSEALKLQEEVLPLERKVKGPEHPDTLMTIHNLANSYGNVGREAEGLCLHEEVLALRRKVIGPEHPQTIKSMYNVARFYDGVGRHEEALKLREEVVRLHRKVLGLKHPSTLWTTIELAKDYRKAGRGEEAVPLGQSALEGFRQTGGETNAATLNAMTELAISYRVAGRTEEAISLETESLRLKREHLPPGHASTLESLDNLATCYEQSNRKAEAEALRQELAELKTKAANQRPVGVQSQPTPAKP